MELSKKRYFQADARVFVNQGEDPVIKQSQRIRDNGRDTMELQLSIGSTVVRFEVDLARLEDRS